MADSQSAMDPQESARVLPNSWTETASDPQGPSREQSAGNTTVHLRGGTEGPVLYDAYGVPGVIIRSGLDQCHLDAARYYDRMRNDPRPQVRQQARILAKKVDEVKLLRQFYDEKSPTWSVGGRVTKKMQRNGWQLEASVPNWLMVGLLARYGGDLFEGTENGKSVWDRWLNTDGKPWRVS